MKKQFLLVFVLMSSLQLMAGNKIKIYFNHPVDNSVSTSVNAVYLNSCIADTLVAYINRSKYTIDIAQYDYNQGSTANIATAINNAYSRGVSIRWIYDGTASNTGLSLLNAGIPTLGSPTTSAYNIMHDKIIIIDAHSTNPNDPLVITGSMDWSTEQFNTDYNNTIILQDSALAYAYTAEFNMMWGSTTLVPNTTTSKFGPYKTDLGLHTFMIEGKLVELYFSPSDNTDTHIQTTISTANTDLYFGMYTFTESTDASMIVAKHTAGVYVAGIDDSYSDSYTPYTIFTATGTGLGANFISFTGTGIYHNKFLIVDPSNACSDPMVLTGSHNWTVSADTKNDENTLIIHDDTIANIYYQSFHKDFIVNGGALTIPTGCPASVPLTNTIDEGVNIFPNPSTGEVHISGFCKQNEPIQVDIFNIIGQRIAVITNQQVIVNGIFNIYYTFKEKGMYLLKLKIGDQQLTKKVFITK